MNFLELIEKKKRKEDLSYSEMKFCFDEYLAGNVPEYQMSAFLMAVYFQGMTDEETGSLTKIMIESGDRVDLSKIEGIVVDKHSTGGVGDSTSLVLGPILASCGLNVGKMSGKGLGHTGGTLDKLGSIPGFDYELSVDELIDITNKNKIVIAGQTADITPLDKRLYDLRNASATVDSIPLITASIMSKKLAITSDIILIDVKVGEGAFMKDIDQAMILAKKLVQVGEDFGRKTIAILTNMEQPLGQAVGNALEVEEAFETLKGRGPSDLKELCLHFSGRILSIAKNISYDEARKIAEESISKGYALQKARDMIYYQKGDPSIVDNYDLFPKAAYSYEIKSDREGYIGLLPAREIGNLARDLGAGRVNMNDKLDLAAGVFLEKKIGDRVQVGDTLATLYGSKLDLLEEKGKEFLEIVKIDRDKPQEMRLILEEVGYGA